jgi:hypothetical protein
MVHQSESVRETNTYIGLEGSLDRAHKGLEFRHDSVSAIKFKVPRRWQCVLLVFFADDTSWISLLFPIIFRSEFHVGDESPVTSFSGQEVLYS